MVCPSLSILTQTVCRVRGTTPYPDRLRHGRSCFLVTQMARPRLAPYHGNAVCWCAHLCTMHAIWLQDISMGIFKSPPDTISILCDDQGAIALGRDNQFHAQTKHINICFRFGHYTVKQYNLKLFTAPRTTRLPRHTRKHSPV